ncbi:9187_t:CDS:2 [Cetraspora pellucida]|uniref:9187_t:CDS:1 n=2 Tax=Cetraspora pellucida TaxID=1433469 RepID=A0ACA9JZ45_9GLOM|nr:9175_t:CDS:2 [Cetraspora pellucida]CAG8441271.1 9187_t:CDS:2 [Cetraspora pellucida]
MTTIIAFISQKGGVGKSTLSRALATEASKEKMKVLLADCDPQQGTMIIDGPARTSKSTLEIATKANLIIQPTGPSVDDCEPAVKEFHALKEAGIEKKKLLFVLNHLTTTGEEINARAYLTQAGYSVLNTGLTEKASYRSAQNQGLAITEVIYEKLKKQAQKLIDEILTKL